MKFITTILLLVFLAGCQSSLYNVDGYYSSLYEYRRAPSEETLQRHIENLVEIVDNNVKTPPGIYLELAYFYDMQGSKDRARQFYEKEMQLYPESTIFVTELMKSKSGVAK